MKNNDWIEIELYYDNHCYETEVLRCYIKPEEIVFSEHTSEHAPGDSYGLSYILTSQNMQKFISCIKEEGIDLEETIKRKFSGAIGVEKFKAICMLNQIEYRIYL